MPASTRRHCRFNAKQFPFSLQYQPMPEVNMSEVQPNPISGTIAITVFSQENGQYFCELSSSLGSDPKSDIGCHGQTQSHAIAIALEQLADEYRNRVEEEQGLEALAVERSESGEVINKHYHVILHYERIAEDESMFEATHNTIMGNTVVENAKITVVEIDPDLPVEPIVRSWDY
jgi:hypothetical protein